MQNYLITAGSLIVLAIMILALIIVKKALSKIQQEIINKNKLIEEYKAVIEKKSRTVDSLSCLYNEAIETANIKTGFFIDITHELRTPLNVIISALQLIEQKNFLEKKDLEKVKNLLNTIKSNSYSLVRLVNNILDVARSDSRCLDFNPVYCNIAAIIQDIVRSTAPFAEQKGIYIFFNSERKEIYAAIDIEKFEKIVLNLLSNAIKYIKKGDKVNISINDKNEYVQISVKDNGPGIPENMHSVIFEKFRQSGQKLTKVHEGSGIGLSIVKTFVELHNGNVRLVSKENAGAEFIVELPKKQYSCKETTVNNYIHDTDNIARLTAIELSNTRFN